jgi:hypothetical protein
MKDKMQDVRVQGDVGDGIPYVPRTPRRLIDYTSWDSTSTRPMNSPYESAGNDKLDDLLTLSRKQADGDPLWENILEFGDMTGVASWDDLWRAYSEFKRGDGTKLNILLEGVGALPIVGKIKKIMALNMMPNVSPVKKNLAKAANAYGSMKVPLDVINKGDAVQDAWEDNIKPSLTPQKLLYEQ